MALPRCSAGQWLASGPVGYVCCDDREDKPRGQEPPPVKFGSKVERDYPHLEQSHQLEDSRACRSKNEGASRVPKSNLITIEDQFLKIKSLKIKKWGGMNSKLLESRCFVWLTLYDFGCLCFH